ncbi:MAG TPA: ABC transporter ATP-binding protein [Hypericibacter adhaerens]|jgi:oligopeptide transport system ATP-binding protein|uniref:ABC transporter ATP-binding protein n=1 Tax=Hypericibacter adhaerens TaxID=2602016 RepID=A0A5J6N5X1_9PROT|nr:ABC transporter ATP-binding protein [Hypericibacter adhaerens]QEX24073.1 ABC transporter ATP-binding protein [Hypericibacter adhaerens]HWA45264.1 ABC transporter ATP-binding protein [Hypericibacter adhaerens]
MSAQPALRPGTAPVFEIENLHVRFKMEGGGEIAALDGISFAIAPGETVGIVGESGSGKTQTFLAAMGLLARNGRASGHVRFAGTEILGLPPAELNRLRGARFAMVFQDPMTSLNPFLTVERQLTEVLVTHRGFDGAQARKAAIAMLERVQIPEPERRIGMYPFEFSGGMRQRVMIAMALLCGPEFLIADEPTTALDVTIQAQILTLLAELKRDSGMALALITHDLGVVAGLCDRVLVLYAGRIVEEAPVHELFRDPRHPYSAGLLASVPRADPAADDADEPPLIAIPGQPPNLQHLPSGCAFRTRCPHAFERCVRETPPLRAVGPGRTKACHLEVSPAEAERRP